MELNWIFYNSKATHVKNAEKIDFSQSNLFFLSLVLFKSLTFFKFQINKKKVIFPSISDMGCFRVIKNSVWFEYECSILSHEDKKTNFTKNQNIWNNAHKIFGNFV
jgi:hypothetical protein